MWRDLDLRAHELAQNEVVRHLVEHPGEPIPSTTVFPDAHALDREMDPAATYCPLDADSSQLRAIHAGAAGHTFVLEGPPGTGKSQTIANLIAHALAMGRRVLFVSEKMAALNVVYKRLAKVGLGPVLLGAALEQGPQASRPRATRRGARVPWRRRRYELAGRHRAPGRRAPRARRLRGRDAPPARLRGLGPPGPLPSPRRVVRTDGRAGLRRARRPRRRRPPRHAGRGRGHDGRAGGDRGPRDTPLPRLAHHRVDPVAAGAASSAMPASSPPPLLRSTGPAAPWRRSSTSSRGPSPGGRSTTSTPPRAPSPTERRCRARSSRVPASRLPARASRPGSRWWRITPKPTRRSARTTARGSTICRSRTCGGASRRPRPPFGRSPGCAGAGPKKALRAVLAGEHLADRRELIAHLARRARARAPPRDRGRRRRGRGPPGRDVARCGDGRVPRAPRRRAHHRSSPPGCAAGGGRPRAPRDAARALAGARRRGHGHVDGRRAARRAPRALREAQTAYDAALQPVTEGLALDTALLFGVPEQPAFAERVASEASAWADEVDTLRAWAAWRRARRRAEEARIVALAEAVDAGVVAAETLRPALERGLFTWWINALYEAEPLLRGFSRAEQEARVARFRDLDTRVRYLSRTVVAEHLATRVPRGATTLSSSSTSEMGVVARELKKQRRHMPIRTLFQRIPNLLPRIKPCMLMSPLSVAQYLAPDFPPFDLVVFDEASQIPTLGRDRRRRAGQGAHRGGGQQAAPAHDLLHEDGRGRAAGRRRHRGAREHSRRVPGRLDAELAPGLALPQPAREPDRLLERALLRGESLHVPRRRSRSAATSGSRGSTCRTACTRRAAPARTARKRRPSSRRSCAGSKTRTSSTARSASSRSASRSRR